MNATILEVKNVKKHFFQPKGIFSPFKGEDKAIPAVDDVSFYIKENETVGLVGESGCGKTTIGKTILKLTPIDSGSIIYEGRDIAGLSQSEFAPYRKKMQMIFQDLDAALNPNMRIGAVLKEAINVHHRLTDTEVERRIGELLEQVNLKRSKLSNYPHELSGGEKRRVGIARTLAVGASFIVADEPTSDLDVSIQAQVVNLLMDLQKDLSLSYLFISHDLPIVELVSHKVAVMYLGKIVETGISESIAHSPRHPYTHTLWSSLVEKQSLEASAAGPSSASLGAADFERPLTGCRFAPRCPVFHSKGKPLICTDAETEPELMDIAEAHKVACHFPL
jgi:oligopeptide/dipeptide ABC transporter ATP-binding protein